ncbi:hypothetical protein [Halovenus marina]|uniref:hypothetical protein n=1 Tax=Halovenus marina TaxID=3396621 RepID=UPI003F578C5B
MNDWHVRATVRVPDGDSDGLVEAARRRLERPAAIDDIEIRAVTDIEPTLGATVVECDVTVRTALDAEVTSRLETAPGTEQIGTARPVQ